MSNFAPLSAAIIAVLETVQQAGGAAFADIEPYPTTEFRGTPAVTVTPSDSESDYQTVVSNLRSYIFFVDIYLPIQTEGDGVSVAFADMLTLVDTCLDAFDNSNTLSGACQILIPTPSAWSIVASGTGSLLTARVTLNAKLSVNTNNG